MPGGDTRNLARVSAADLVELEGRGELFPSALDAPQLELDESFWENAEIMLPGERPKASIHLRVDADVLDWFRAQGKGHLTRMNAVLRAYYEASSRKAR